MSHDAWPVTLCYFWLPPWNYVLFSYVSRLAELRKCLRVELQIALQDIKLIFKVSVQVMTGCDSKSNSELLVGKAYYNLLSMHWQISRRHASRMQSGSSYHTLRFARNPFRLESENSPFEYPALWKSIRQHYCIWIPQLSTGGHLFNTNHLEHTALKYLSWLNLTACNKNCGSCFKDMMSDERSKLQAVGHIAGKSIRHRGFIVLNFSPAVAAVIAQAWDLVISFSVEAEYLWRWATSMMLE